MATENKQLFTNVVNEGEPVATKTPISYGHEFDGTEKLKWQPEAFEAFGKTTRMNSADLARKIHAHFKQTFHEVIGCNLIPGPNGQIFVELFFERNTEPLTSGKIINLDSLVDANNSGSTRNIFDKMQAVQNRFTGNVYTLNNETKLLLSKFMFGGDKANLPNNNKWKENVHQVKIAANDPFRRTYGTDRIMVKVTGLDIRSILREIYGRYIITKTEVKETEDTNYRSEARYEVRYIKSMPDGSFIMNIEQFDADAIKDIFMKENPIPQQYFGVQMYSSNN
jgi:hypothetical protein